jgi:hypothetical protein
MRLTEIRQSACILKFTDVFDRREMPKSSQ